MVPVVYGLANYSTIAPAHSFINTKDFKSVKDLATYLLHLDKHPREYLKYFRWRKRFRVLDTVTGDNDLGDLTWCEFCTKLHATDVSKSRKWYDNLEEWYRRNYTNSSVCTKTYLEVWKANQAGFQKQKLAAEERKLGLRLKLPNTRNG